MLLCFTYKNKCYYLSVIFLNTTDLESRRKQKYFTVSRFNHIALFFLIRFDVKKQIKWVLKHLYTSIQKFSSVLCGYVNSLHFLLMVNDHEIETWV